MVSYCPVTEATDVLCVFVVSLSGFDIFQEKKKQVTKSWFRFELSYVSRLFTIGILVYT